jgi:hypothetical protein
MEPKFRTEDEILELVRSFENATVASDAWRHAEHLVVALYYVTCNDNETSYTKMRDGILNLLTKGFGVDLSKEMPYHVTLTRFWIETVADFNASKSGASLLEKANEVAYKWDKNYPLKFYTRDVLYSAEARRSYVAPDRTDLSPIDRRVCNAVEGSEVSA